MARKIEGYSRVRLLEMVELPVPGVRIGARTVQEEQKLALIQPRRHAGERRATGVVVVDRDTADVKVLAEHEQPFSYQLSASGSRKALLFEGILRYP
jgi:hypothetical protein